MTTRGTDDGMRGKEGVQLVGDWTLAVVKPGTSGEVCRLKVAPPPLVTVTAEHAEQLPLFNPDTAGWCKGRRLAGVMTDETSAKHMVEPDSLELRLSTDPTSPCLARGVDYEADQEWGTLGRLEGGRIGLRTGVFLSYRHGLSRLDSVVRRADGDWELRAGIPHITVSRMPDLLPGDIRAANIWVPGRLPRLGTEHLFPILESRCPDAPPARTLVERCLPRTLAKLNAGQPLRILAWGDSVTTGGYLPDIETAQWQVQFVRRLQARFPRARLELVTEAWGGRNTSSYLELPPGEEHNFAETVLARRPDLVISEFVNDMGLTAERLEANHSRCLADFRRIGAEWIILTPHYVRPDWMDLTREREIDADPRPLVAFLREFTARHDVALADASRRWGRLWRQGIPYTTLFLNAINHPDVRGMALFADSLMEWFA